MFSALYLNTHTDFSLLYNTTTTGTDMSCLRHRNPELLNLDNNIAWDITEKVLLNLPTVYFETLGKFSRKMTDVLIQENNLADLKAGLYNKLIYDFDAEHLAIWINGYFGTVSDARRIAFRAADEKFVLEKIGVNSSAFKLDKFLVTLESHPVFTFKFKEHLEEAERYVSSKNFYYLVKHGFFRHFGTWEDFQEYMDEAPELYASSEPSPPLYDILKTKMSMALQKRVGLTENIDPWELVGNMKRVFEEMHPASTRIFEFHSDKEPEQLEIWTNMLLRTNQNEEYLDQQPPEYFEALNTHMTLVFGKLVGARRINITDKASTLEFCTLLKDEIHGEFMSKNFDALCEEDPSTAQELLTWVRNKIIATIQDTNGLCAPCYVFERESNVHDKKDCPWKNFPDYDNFLDNYKEGKVSERQFLEIISTEKKAKMANSRKLPQKNPYDLDFEKMVGEYFDKGRKV